MVCPFFGGTFTLNPIFMKNVVYGLYVLFTWFLLGGWFIR
jgi:hypothetical protein